jgi:hypothetical protein
MGANIKDRDDAGARRFFERAIHLHSALEKITIGQLGADPLRRLRGEACQRQLKVAARGARYLQIRCTLPSTG